MDLDAKEKIMISHYSSVFTDYSFDEYDVLGFLIVARRLIRNNKYRNILEFADLIAHRERNRGQVFDAIKQAIDNQYETYDNNKTVKGYNGTTEDSWKNEWKMLFGELGILYNKRLMDEITLCICSLASGSVYKKNEQSFGKMYAFFNTETIALMTTEGNPDSLSVWYFVYKGITAEIKNKYGYQHCKEAFETKRIDGDLVLMTKEGTIFLKLKNGESAL